MFVVEAMMPRGARLLRGVARRHLSAQAASEPVRVRFAPSPTGRLHLGSLRTALYNYLFARAKRGRFVLRVEDTDQQRLVPGAADEFERVLDLYGLHRDEGPSQGGRFGPYVQSERLPFYVEAAEQLIEDGHAYRCFCTPERLELLRRKSHQDRTNHRYDGRCRQVPAAESRRRAAAEPHTVRFRFERRALHFRDLAFGAIRAQADEGDFVILKSDRWPTYHLASVVDDRRMRVTHVIRGQEWLASVPKHVSLYGALNWPTPTWVHLPLIMRTARRKLSKRDADAFADFYHDQKGYLRTAVLNLLIRNGAGIRDFQPRRLYTIDELVERFDENLLGVRNLQLDSVDLEHYGRAAIRAAAGENTLKQEIRDFFNRKNANVNPNLLGDEQLDRAIQFLLNNEEAFSHMAQLLKPEDKAEKEKFTFLFTKPTGPIQVARSLGSAHHAAHLLRQLLEHTAKTSWSLPQIQAFQKAHDLPTKPFFHLLRLAIIDNVQGPPISELIDYFGMSEVENRIKDQIQWLEGSEEKRLKQVEQ